MDEDETKHPPHGHITSLSVLRTHRKRGIATLLMKRSQTEMATVFGAYYVSLHVRKSNRAAFHLYNETLKYEIHDIERGYYADGEDAYDMRCTFAIKTTLGCLTGGVAVFLLWGNRPDLVLDGGFRKEPDPVLQPELDGPCP